MRIRAYEERDLEALQRIHAAQGFGYAFPAIEEPLFLTKLILTNGADGNSFENSPGQGIVGAALLRLTAEAYLLLDPKQGTPRERWRWTLGLHEATEREALARGLEDVHAWLPPEIAERFGKRIEKLGWVRDDRWVPYCRKLRSYV